MSDLNELKKIKEYVNNRWEEYNLFTITETIRDIRRDDNCHPFFSDVESMEELEAFFDAIIFKKTVEEIKDLVSFVDDIDIKTIIKALTKVINDLENKE